MTSVTQQRQCVSARGLDRVGGAEEARERSVHAQEHDGLSLGPGRVGSCVQRSGLDPVFGQQGLVPQNHIPSMDDADHALPGGGLEVLDCRQVESPGLGRGDHGLRQRMLASSFDGGREL
jgi:hypothetical protein